MNARFLHVLLSSLWIFSSGCDSGHHGHEHAQQTTEAEESDSHDHPAPHGGTLVEIGDHLYNLEFVQDRENGSLDLYVLGPHASDPVRLSQSTIEVMLQPEGAAVEATFEAQANTLSGERVGSTSVFALEHE
ncbi:MAG: hypothetical protein AAF368_13765, partial [Planctomycetota bacterium]